jgi:uncharacterized protein (DUF362 family)
VTAPRESVAVSSTNGGYPREFPFDADERFPEYRGSVAEDDPNPVYRAVRDNFELLGFDAAHFGTPEWNPLGHLVKPGDRVFIKPNLCTHEYGRKRERLSGDLFSVVTHPSAVRAVADYVAIALEGKGEIIIGDNPTIDADFAKLMEATGYDRFEAFYAERDGVRCSVLDLRQVWCEDMRFYGRESLMRPLPGDPMGETVVNLGKGSFFSGLNPLLFRGVFTNRWETIRHHHGKRQEYALANSIYESDVYISVPKLKAHHKVGATLNIKGLVGACTKKNYLIHWRIGYPSWGGDEYPEPHRMRDHVILAAKHVASAVTPARVSAWIMDRFGHSPIARLFKTGGYRGSWEGNDTCWRMAADLYLALMTRERRCLSVIDGVVGGEGNGPFCPGRREARIVVTGEHLVLTDAVAVRMMDFNVHRIGYVEGLFRRLGLDADGIRVVSRDYDARDFFSDSRSYLAFEAPSGWPNLQLPACKSPTKTGDLP